MVAFFESFLKWLFSTTEIKKRGMLHGKSEMASNAGRLESHARTGVQTG
jgi:hypothetical protein